MMVLVYLKYIPAKALLIGRAFVKQN